MDEIKKQRERISNGVNKKDFLIIIAGIIILIIIVILSFLVPREAGSISVITDNDIYSAGDNLKIKIENNSGNKICFSSCYPYYFEKKEGAWNNYRYSECSKEDKIEKCVEPENIKAFELEISLVKKGVHRIALPACIGCNLNELFDENGRFYSNEFLVR